MPSTDIQRRVFYDPRDSDLGIVSDAVAIQAEIDKAASAGGGDVILRAGSYTLASGLNVPSFVTLWILRGVNISISSAIRAVTLQESARVILDGDIDISGFAGTGIYCDGATGWNTAAHTSAISGKGRILGDYTVNQVGIHLYSNGANAGSNISFLQVNLRVHRCYYGVRLQAVNGGYLNGNVLDVDVAGAVYAWHLDFRTGAGLAVNGNVIRGQVQTVPEMQRVLYCDSNYNKFDLFVWDWGSDRAGFPTAIEFHSNAIINWLETNNIRPGYVKDPGSANRVILTHNQPRASYGSIAPGGYIDRSFVGTQDDLLFAGDRRYTVTNDFSGSSIDRLFDSNPTTNVSCADCALGNTKSVTVTFSSPLTGLDSIGIHFGQNRYATHVAIDVDQTGAGGWVTLLERSSNISYEARVNLDEAIQAGTYSGPAHAIRVRFDGYASGQSSVFLNRFWAFGRDNPGAILSRPSVTGSRANPEQALANALARLHEIGIISNSTTA